MITVPQALRSYWLCVVNALEGSAVGGRRRNNNRDKNKKLAECRKALISDVLFIINEQSRIIHKPIIDTAEEALLPRLSLVEIDARLVYRARPGSAEPVVGLDFGFVTHPVFLIPFIPGSSVKGVLRSVYEGFLRERFGDGPVARECVRALFGLVDESLGGVGPVVAFDAFPASPGVGGVFVVGDVVTPHYRGDDASLETEMDAMPKPAIGASVDEGTVFRFVIGVDEEYALERVAGARDCLLGFKDPANLVAVLALAALEEVGVGGKSTRGYGLFEVQDMAVVRQMASRTIKWGRR